MALSVPSEPSWPIPKLLIKVINLSHPGAITFFDNLHPHTVLKDAVLSVFKWLYTPDSVPKHVRSVTLVLRPMDGVAYTTGSDLDNDHKEIHFSTNHIRNSGTRATHEIIGVLTHEMVHCFQFNGKGTCPSGFIEGVADWVRLNCNLGPPHWKKGGKKWDEGYQTTAYFLDWIEKTYGEGTIRRINASLRDAEYSENIFSDATGYKVEALWETYKASLDEEKST